LIRGKAKRFFCSSKHPDWVWDPPSLQFSEYWGIFARVFKDLGYEACNSEDKNDISESCK
jgi:hypothetical protein